jgi:hypothetical protein
VTLRAPGDGFVASEEVTPWMLSSTTKLSACFMLPALRCLGFSRAGNGVHGGLDVIAFLPSASLLL